MRIMGLDIGTVRIGVALSDETYTIASPLVSLNAKAGVEAVARELRPICEENEVGLLLVGLPLSMSGEDRGESAGLARKSATRLGEVLDLEVVYFDERFTTAQAERVLIDADVRREKRKAVVDKVAAAIILQAYLDSRQPDER